uniref:histone-lysine N-methyltransferase SUV39H2-like isoform X5 n=2 Tax=Myxine glutinosa TaxID=7769 RepID=UPI00358F5E23
MTQSQRLEAMERLKHFKCRVLISTDLMSRGIDADKVNLVVNMEVPKDWETYLHRVGRAGRFGTYGLAVTFCSQGEEESQLKSISTRCGLLLRALPDPLSVEVMADVLSTQEVDDVLPSSGAARAIEKTQPSKQSPSATHRINDAAGLCVPCLVPHDHLIQLCRQQGLTCFVLGITRYNMQEFEVEYLCDFYRQRGKEFYYVKWKGWPESENTWVAKRDLHCSKLLRIFHNDLDRIIGKELMQASTCSLPSAATNFMLRRGKQLDGLARWEEELNKLKHHQHRIVVENNVDLEGPPKAFHYINDYQAADGVTLVQEPIIGCSCEDCYAERESNCCANIAFMPFAYSKNRHVRLKPGQPIYECNTLCLCSSNCPNRVVQKGIVYDLCVFRTDNGRGWGVRTLHRISKNSFVMEYIGEIITSDEAELRGDLYDCLGTTYLFDLDFFKDEYTVDATYYGNISHFVNHSCEPNLQVYNVFINNHDLGLPRIAFFTTRDVRVGEELTFDYNMKVADHLSTPPNGNVCSPGRQRLRIPCKCGSENCRKWLV